MRKLTFLGTGRGLPIASSCTSILLEDEKTSLLIDAGGGHDIIVQFNKAKRKPTEVKNVFISHYDSDHILGFIPLVRAFHTQMSPPKEKIRVFCSKEVKAAIDSMFEFVAKEYFQPVSKFLEFIIIQDEMGQRLGDWKLEFFDVRSDQSPQMGFAVTFSDGKKLSFCGDEPLREANIALVQKSDVLIHNAFCLDREESQFKAHEKNHSTVKDAVETGQRIGAKSMVLFHMEDKTLPTRKERYLKEARQYFKGKIVVPVDLDAFEF